MSVNPYCLMQFPPHVVSPEGLHHLDLVVDISPPLLVLRGVLVHRVVLVPAAVPLPVLLSSRDD